MQAQHQLGVSAGRRSFVFSPALFKSTSLNDCSFSLKGASIACQFQADLPRCRLHSPIAVSASLPETVAESSADFVKVKFVLQRRCEFGQQFNLVGDDDSFGAWDPKASIPMQWSEGHVWTTQAEVLVGKRVEYKVILLGGEGVVDWEPGPNCVLEPLELQSSPLVLETQWGEDGVGIQLDELDGSACNEHLNELESLGQSSSITNVDGVTSLSVHSGGILDTELDHHEETAERDTVEPLIEAQQLAIDLAASEEAEVGKEREATVLEKDLRWGREALSTLWSTLKQSGNKSEE